MWSPAVPVCLHAGVTDRWSYSNNMPDFFFVGDREKHRQLRHATEGDEPRDADVIQGEYHSTPAVGRLRENLRQDHLKTTESSNRTELRTTKSLAEDPASPTPTQRAQHTDKEARSPGNGTNHPQDTTVRKPAAFEALGERRGTGGT